MIVIIAIRGATTCSANSKGSILEATTELLRAIITLNEVENTEIVSMLFTATPDITAAFPAQAARMIGLTDIPLMGAQELAVEGAPKLCIRVMLHTTQSKERSEVRHVYLNGTRVLRPDLVQKEARFEQD
ncbi:MAG: chorismate mutase [Bacillota bacterium]|nr:MAG: chorismate mutase [Bacillota bacterium]